MNRRRQEPTTPAPRRSRFRRYGLRTLLAAMTVVAVVCAYAAGVRRQYVFELEAARRFEKLGCDVGFGYSPPPWLRWSKHEWPWYRRIWLVNFHGGVVLDPATAESIGRLSQLVDLSNIYGEADDAALAHWDGLSKLQVLRVQGEKITDAGLSPLKNLTQLEVLAIWGANVRGDGLAHLQSCPNLRELDLRNCAVGDHGIKHLSNHRKLTHLILADNPITDEGLSELGSLEALMQLHLERTDVTGTGFAGLNTANLRELHLLESPVSDQGVKEIGILPALVVLDLGGTSVTNEGLRHLSQARNLDLVSLQDTAVSDLSPLQDAPRLKTILADNANVGADLPGFTRIESGVLVRKNLGASPTN